MSSSINDMHEMDTFQPKYFCQLNDKQLHEVTDFLLLNPFVTADDASILFTAKFGVLICTSDIFKIEDLVTTWAKLQKTVYNDPLLNYVDQYLIVCANQRNTSAYKYKQNICQRMEHRNVIQRMLGVHESIWSHSTSNYFEVWFFLNNFQTWSSTSSFLVQFDVS